MYLDDPKNAHLRELEGAKERLVLCKADLLDYESLKEAFNGCDGVFHTASPVTDDPVSLFNNIFVSHFSLLVVKKMRTCKYVLGVLKPFLIDSGLVSFNDYACITCILPLLSTGFRSYICLMMIKEKMLEPAVIGTKNVIVAAAEAKVRRVVFTSSIGTVYMDPNRSPDIVVDEHCWSDLEYCKNTKVNLIILIYIYL